MYVILAFTKKLPFEIPHKSVETGLRSRQESSEPAFFFLMAKVFVRCSMFEQNLKASKANVLKFQIYILRNWR